MGIQNVYLYRILKQDNAKSLSRMPSEAPLIVPQSSLPRVVDLAGLLLVSPLAMASPRSISVAKT